MLPRGEKRQRDGREEGRSREPRAVRPRAPFVSRLVVAAVEDEAIAVQVDAILERLLFGER